MSPFLVQLLLFYDFGTTFEPGSEAYRNLVESFSYVFLLICVPLISTVGAVGPERSRHGGVRGAIGAPTSPLGLSPKIEEEEKRRS